MKLIQPIFINETKTKVTGLGVANKSYTLADAIARIKLDTEHDVSSFLLFLIPSKKSWDPLWEWQKTVLATIRTKFPNIEIYVDTCMCSTLPDGHCCVLKDHIESEEVLQRLVRIIEHANCKMAHSDMGPNTALNARMEFPELEIISYVKWRSNLYEGFRSTADSTPESARTYQIEVDDADGFIHMANKYIKSDCNSLLLKPGITSVDMLHQLRQKTDMPIGGYQVSGEWLPIKDQVAAIQEQHKIYKRSGYDFMVTYGARMFNLLSK
jgi:porphobilinogen synthase